MFGDKILARNATFIHVHRCVPQAGKIINHEVNKICFVVSKG